MALADERGVGEGMGPGAKGLVMVASVVVIAAGLKAARPVLTPVLLAALITMASAPLMAWLRHRRVPGSLSVALVLLSVLCALTLLGLLVASGVDGLMVAMPRYEAEGRRALRQGIEFVADSGIHIAPDWAARVFDPAPLLGMAGRALQSVASALSMATLVLLIVAFMLFESLGLRGKLERVALSAEHIDELKRASRLVDRYLAVKTLASAVTGLLIGLWNHALGVELAMLWGLTAFVLNYVPTVGSILAAIPAVALAMLELGPGAGALLAGGYLAVNFVIGNGFEPRVMGAVLGLSPLVVFFSLLFWGFLLGPVGALVSVPLTIVVRIYLASMADLAWLAILLGPPQQEDVVTASLPPPPAVPAQASVPGGASGTTEDGRV